VRVGSIVYPTTTQGATMGAVSFLTAVGRFIGQFPAFFQMLHDLARAADAAQRGI
jgi:hypothetical protein